MNYDYDYETIALALELANKYNKEELQEKLKNLAKLQYHEIIIDTVCRYTLVNVNDIYKKTRKEKIVRARHLSMHFIKKYKPSLKDKDIGKIFDRDRTVSIYAHKSVLDSLIMADYKELYDKIDKKLKLILCRQ